MHVALCTDGVFPNAMGGMQRHSRLLAEHLAKRPGIRLAVLHPHAERVFDPALGINEVRVPAIDPGSFYLRELWKYSGHIATELDGLKPDVILSQGFCVWKGIDRFTGRLAVLPHGLEMFQALGFKERLMGWPFRWALRGIVRKSAVVVSLGGKLTDILHRMAQGSACRVVVIPNAVEVPDQLAQRSAPEDQRTSLQLLFVGRFAFNKGIDVLMNVAGRIQAKGSPDVKFLLAGEGPLLEHYRSKGLPKNVELLGRVDDARLSHLYRACDALILPTRFEGMPTVVLEAMAQGKPVIVSDVGATAELVNMHNGYLLPAGDAEALYTAVLAFSERTPEVHRMMGRYSYERVKERFSWPVVRDQFEQLIGSFAN